MGSRFLCVAERCSIARMDQFIPSSVLEKLTYRERVVGRKKNQPLRAPVAPSEVASVWVLVPDHRQLVVTSDEVGLWPVS